MFRTRLTSAFGIEHPIVLAPMDLVADARLAGAVSAAGGLGLLGGGYGDREWLERQLGEVTPGSVGRGFITWSLARRPELLDLGLEHRRPPSSCPSATRRPSPTGSTAPASRCSARSAPWARRTGRSTSARARSSRRAARPAGTAPAPARAAASIVEEIVREAAAAL